MSFGSIPRRCLATALAGAIASVVHAGPVLLDDAASAAEPLDAKIGNGATPHADSVGIGPHADPAGAVARRARADAAESNPADKPALRERREPSLSAIGRGPLPERLGRAPPDTSRRAGGPDGSPGPARPPHADDGLATATKSMAVAALAWINEALPWARSKPAGEQGEPKPSAPAESGEFAAEMGIDNAAAAGWRADRHSAEPNAAGTAREVTFSTSTTDRPERRYEADPAGTNWVRESVKFGRELVQHPLTWLVVLVIGIAHILLSRAGRGK